MNKSKQLIFVSSSSCPESHSFEFHSLCENEDEEFIPVLTTKVSNEELFPIAQPEMISGHFFVQNHCHPGQSVCFCPGGRVYCVGGSRTSCGECMDLPDAELPSTDVYCWDAKNYVWNRLTPPMNVARIDCSLNVLRGKLYVHEKNMVNVKPGGVFMEVLDDENNRWINLPYPPQDVKLDLTNFSTSAVESKGYFLFGSKACNHFYAFKPPGTWILIDHLPFDSMLMLDIPLYSPVVTEDYLLWLHSSHPSLIVGFDHSSGVYFMINLLSEGIYPTYASFDHPFLAYAGNGVLALAWIDTRHYDSVTLCNCVKFSLHLEENGDARVKLLSRISRVGPWSIQSLHNVSYMEFDDPPSGYSSGSHVTIEEEG